MKVRGLYLAIVSFFTASLLLSSCALPGAAPAATNTPAAPTGTPTPTAKPTSTPKPTNTLRPTATLNLVATQKVEEFAAKVKEYYDDQYISTTAGEYTDLGNSEQTLADGLHYQWWNTWISPTDFVLKSDIAWKNSSSSPNRTSGCGFVFHLKESGFTPSSKNTYYVIFVSWAGYVVYWSATGNYTKSMGTAYYGVGQQTGSAAFTLIVEGTQFRVLINNKLIKTFSGYTANFNQGVLSYAVISGTNKGAGTTCNFNNSEVWTLQH